MFIETKYFLPAGEEIFAAAQEAGYSVGDLNSFQFPIGFSKIDYNMKNGYRRGTFKAFLEPVLEIGNLKILRYAWAKKVQKNSKLERRKKLGNVVVIPITDPF